MFRFIAALIVALVAPPAPNEDGAAKPPASYVLSLGAAYADVTVTMNGVPLLDARVEAPATRKITLSSFLKSAGNHLVVSFKPAFPGQRSGGAIELIRFVVGGGQSAIETLFTSGHGGAGPVATPYEKTLDFDAPGTPRLAFWTAEPAPLDDAAKREIVAALDAFQDKVDAGLAARQTADVVTLFATFSGNLDAGLFLDNGGTKAVVESMVDTFAPPVNDPTRVQLSPAPRPSLADLAFVSIGAHVLVRRKDGAPTLGFLFAVKGGHLGGLTIDQPIFGHAGGRWAMLQDIPLPRQ